MREVVRRFQDQEKVQFLPVSEGLSYSKKEAIKKEVACNYRVFKLWTPRRAVHKTRRVM